MKLLIDTQIILWFQNSDPKLSKKIKELILDNGNSCLISIASLWEIAIKINLNKLIIGMPFEEFPEYLITKKFEILNVEFSHLKLIAALDNHHNDPFDRLIISQAISENLTIISSDRQFAEYPVPVI